VSPSDVTRKENEGAGRTREEQEGARRSTKEEEGAGGQLVIYLIPIKRFGEQNEKQWRLCSAPIA